MVGVCAWGVARERETCGGVGRAGRLGLVGDWCGG